MADPNPIWGVHVAPGALAAVHAVRRDDGVLVLLDAVEQSLPADPVEATEEATAFLRERSRRGHAAFIAVPDHDGSITSCVLTRDESERAPDELRRVLFNATQFAPEEAKLWHRPITAPGQVRGFLVAALRRDDANGYFDALAPLDARTYGMGFASVALAYGARALGLVGRAGAVVEVLPEYTIVHALAGVRHRRYPLPIGSDELRTRVRALAGVPQSALPDPVLLRAETSVEASLRPHLERALRPLIRDIICMLGYHTEFASGRPGPSEAPQGDICPVGPVAAGHLFGPPLRAGLGPRAASLEPAPNRLAVLRRSRRGREETALPLQEAARLTGAIGAALLGQLRPDAVPVVRSVPEDVPPPRRGCLPGSLEGLIEALNRVLRPSR